MADQNQQLADTVARLNSELSLYGELTQSTADSLNDARVGIKGFSAATRMAGGAVESVGRAATAAAGAMYEGKKGAAAFNDSIGELGNAAKIAAAALALLVPGGPIIKLFVAGLGMAVSATADYVKAANEMADKLYSGYSKMAKTGAAASDGMTGLYNDAKKLGLSMNQLDSYVSLIGDNSKDLALFGGTVFEGRKKFADMGKAMEPFRAGLIAAGYTQEEINDASMQYLRLQTRIGQSQNMTTQQLAEGARKYLVEQDALAKITGMSRQEQEQALEAGRSQQRFRAKLEEMRNSGDADQIAGAKKLEEQYVMLSKYNKKAAEGFGDITTGMIGTEAAMQFNMLTMGKGNQVAAKLAANQMEVAEAFQEISNTSRETSTNLNTLGQTGVFDEVFGSFVGSVELGIAGQRDVPKALAEARAEIAKQGMEGGKAADGITDQYAKNIKKQQELNKQMEDSVFKGIENAQRVTSGLADATGVLTTAFAKLTDGVNSLMNIVGGEPEREITKQEQDSNKKVDEAKKAFEESVKDAGFSAKTLGIGLSDSQKKLKQQYLDAEEAAKAARESAEARYEIEKQTKKGAERQAARTGVAAPSTSAPATSGGGEAAVSAPAAKGVTPSTKEGEGGTATKPEDVLKFTGQSGSASAFAGLEQNLQTAVVNAGEQYNAVTGGKLQINSAKRSREDQQRLWDETVKLGTPGKGPKGMLVAEPGTSLHEQGQSVDIDNYKDPEARSALASQGLRQPFPVKDPVHYQFRDGGIASGPESGFAATLHGTEAVIPLKSGAIPIKFEMPTMPGMPDDVESATDSGSIADMISEFRNALKEMPAGQQGNGSMAELTSMIGELIREQRNANDISARILQVSAN